MPQLLQDLTVDEVSLVDRPANASVDPATGRKVARARIALWKRDGTEEILKAAAGVKFVLGFPKDGSGSKVQSVIFDKDKWTPEKARVWLKDHNFAGTEVDETGESYRYRQEDPSKFSRFRTIAPGAAGKGDESTVQTHKFNPNHDEHGLFAESGSAASATGKAMAASRALIGHTPGTKKTAERNASRLHAEAARLHREEAARGKGDASQHATQAKLHDQYAQEHEEWANWFGKADKVESELRALCKADDAWDDSDPLCMAVDGGGGDGVCKAGACQTQGGKCYPRSDYAYAPDDTPSHWKIRLTNTPGGKPDPKITGAAAAALGPKGFRGRKAKIPAEALAGVKAKVRAAWRAANPDKGEDEMPESLRKGDATMTVEEIVAKVEKQETELAALKADNDVLKAENELVMKMTKKERKLYAAMSTEKRKAYMAADTEKRKAMLGEADDERKCAKALSTLDDAAKRDYEASGPARRREILADALAKLAKAKKTKDDDEDEEDEEDEEDVKEANKALALKLAGTQDRLAKTEDRVAKTDAELAEIRKRERIAKFTKRAEEELPHTAGTPEEKGTMLMEAADHLPGGESGEGFRKYFDSLKAADRALSLHYGEVGKAGGPIPAEKAWDAKVKEIAKRDNISESKATDKAFQEAPELYLDYERQHRQFAVTQ